MASRQYLKVTVMHYKNPSKTDEEFEEHFCKNINPQWTKIIKKHGFLKYSVTFCPETVSEAALMFEQVRPGWTVLRSHAALTYLVPDFEYINALASDPEYLTIAKSLEAGWIDSSRGEIVLGYEKVFFDDTKASGA
ncbi:hypothetical protein LZ31DRAFT_599375 [Colletotrichum somersetense]|nr:hypothetical protein LZ31DRAFT_599375 [Colletotrichum somersetense]